MERGSGRRLRVLGVAALSAYARAQSYNLDYDCQAGFGNCEAGWSAAKKSWCCNNNMCCQGAVPLPYNCNSDSPSGWTHTKRTWCCIHEKKGCRCSGKQYDCNAGLDMCVSGWSDSKKDFCYHCRAIACNAGPSQRRRRRQGFPFQPTGPTYGKVPETPAYDCDINFHHQAHWSMDQRSWCCDRDPKYCAPYNCHSNDLHSEWPVTKQRWCCSNRGVCVSGHPFDCAAGVGAWQTGWSPAKKAYCCQETGNLGCPGRLLYEPTKYEVSDAEEKEPLLASEPNPAMAALAMSLAAIAGLGLGAFSIRAVCRRAAASQSQTYIMTRGSHDASTVGDENELKSLE